MQWILATVLAGMAPAGEQCRALEVSLTPEARRDEAALVTRVSGQHVREEDVGRVLAEGEWRLVWATPQEAERGVFFFQRDGDAWKLVEIWGGIALPEDRAETIAWARALPGAPPDQLSECFVDGLLAEG